jgi:hypothetical protein
MTSRGGPAGIETSFPYRGTSEQTEVENQIRQDLIWRLWVTRKAQRSSAREQMRHSGASPSVVAQQLRVLDKSSLTDAGCPGTAWL